MNQVFGNIKTQRKSVVLVFNFTTTTTEAVYFIAKDSDRKKIIYFNREYIPAYPGPQEVELTLPFSPSVTELVTFSKGDYSISQIATYPMRKQSIPDAEMQDFLFHAEDFAQKFKTASHGTYKSPSGKFVYKYVTAIRDEHGSEVPTPMQVDHVTGEVAIDSKRVQHYTAQMLVAALLHENFHYRLDTKNESTCDLSAAEVAVDNGYMKTEIYHAYTSVFDDSAENIRRSDALNGFLLQHNVNIRG